MTSFLDILKERIVVFDGAMGTNLQVQNLTLEDFGGLLRLALAFTQAGESDPESDLLRLPVSGLLQAT